MADRWAVVVGIDKHLHPGWGTTPYAEPAAKALADALAAAGYPRENQTVLLGPHATKAAVDSRLRKLRKAVRRGDAVLVYWAGRSFAHAGRGHLAGWDTLPDDPADTAVSLADLLDAVGKASQAVFLLDTGTGPAVGGADPHLDAAQLARLFADSPTAVALLAADPGDPAHAAAGVKAPVWTHLVTDALLGRLPRAVGKDGTVTALSLHEAVTDELPRLFRKHHEPGVTQTPRLYGEQNAGLAVADLGHLVGRDAGGGLLDPARLRRVVFRSDSTGRVRDLSGWRKTFELPTTAGPSSRKFVARAARDDLRADLDGVFDAAREHLGYKRKDLDVSAEDDGFGYVRGPDFEYTASVGLDPTDPTHVVWRREVGGFADPGFVRGPGFDAVFGKLFDQLAFEFAAPVDVAALVDRLEESPPDGVRVHVASDGGACDITLVGFAGRVTVGRSALVVRGRAGNSAGLLDQLLGFLRKVGPLGEPPALPPA